MKKYPLILGLITLALSILFFASIIWGEVYLSFPELWDGLRRTDPVVQSILWNIRLPRALVAMAVGASLSISGLMMQAYFKNPLASPGLLGVSSGGALGAVLYIGYGSNWLGMWGLPGASMAGAFLATFLVLSLSEIGLGTQRLLLAGIALNALLGAATSFVLSLSVSSFERSGQILFWLLGSLEDRTWEHVWVSLPLTVVLGFFITSLGSPMNLLSLGESGAQSLGVNVRQFRWKMIILSTLLTAVATAVAGVIGFVGLIIPHIFRLLLGPDHKRLIPCCLIGGAAFLLGCDLISRTLNIGLRVGVITSLIGGPFFLWLLQKRAV
ncbi:MAG: FecCD family ABC transporter permease [Holophagaceae bacterium]|jgi:iron complex transport system permease protein